MSASGVKAMSTAKGAVKNAPKRPLSPSAGPEQTTITSFVTQGTQNKRPRVAEFDAADFKASLMADGNPSDASVAILSFLIDLTDSPNGISLRDLLALECETLGSTWLPHLHKELTKSYFLNLKRFLHNEGVRYPYPPDLPTPKVPSVFPLPRDIYSWSRHTRLDKLKVVILGQDPYHNVGQAHGEWRYVFPFEHRAEY